MTRRRSEVFIIRRREIFQAFCNECADESVWLTIDETVLTTRIKTREILQFIENDFVHTRETADGRLLICVNSLRRRF